MTANTSPRLGLMLPTNADVFTPDDFSQTFSILDAKPGVTSVPNYAGLPTNLTTSQHMSCYIQADNGAEWYWYQPSSGSPGVWKRRNNLGLIGLAQQTSNVSTTGTNPTTAPTLMSATITAPGARYIRVDVVAKSVTNNSAAHAGIVSLWLNGAISYEVGTAGSSTAGSGIVFSQFYLPSTPGQSMAFKATLRGAAVAGGGGTTISNAVAFMFISEV